MKKLKAALSICLALLALQCFGACALHLSGTLEPPAEDADLPDSVTDGTGEHIPDVNIDRDEGTIDPFVDDSAIPLDEDAGEGGPDAALDEGGQEDAAAEADMEEAIEAACDPALCPGRCCDDASGGGCCHYLSCNDLHGAHPELPSGVYEIDTDGDLPGSRAAFEVYCDMAADGGGWTLVGRSTVGVPGTVAFGWKSAMGSVHADDQPYSLNVEGAGVSFTVILAGSYSSGKLWGSNAYKMQVPTDFLSSYSNSSYTISGGPATVIGGCTPSGGPTMLRRAGYTDKTTRFHFRDQWGDYDVGLRVGGFNTYYSDCNRGADLNGLQGMIFVR